MGLINISKKGQGEFVAYVILIGLAVTLAVIVGSWSIGQSQSSSENFERQSEIEDKCGQIAMSVSVDCSPSANTNERGVKITNSGYLTIPYLRINGESGVDCGFGDNKEINLKPAKKLDPSLTIDLNANSGCSKINILPLVNIIKSDTESELVGCSDKRVDLDFNSICE